MAKQHTGQAQIIDQAVIFASVIDVEAVVSATGHVRRWQWWLLLARCG